MLFISPHSGDFVVPLSITGFILYKIFKQLFPGNWLSLPLTDNIFVISDIQNILDISVQIDLTTKPQRNLFYPLMTLIGTNWH